MRVQDHGSSFTVHIEAGAVYEFSKTWPCSGLVERFVEFTFDKRNGDLVDSNDSTHQPGADGGALVALADDAMAYGIRTLKLKSLFYRLPQEG
jgi:hypothetical protein